MYSAWHAGDPQACEAHCTRLLALDAGDPNALLVLGVLCAQRGQNAEAVVHFEKAAERAPELAALHTNKGHALHRLGRWHEAIAAYDQAFALGARQANSLTHRANALHHLYEHEAALQGYDEALTLEPGLLEALIERSDLLIDMGRTDAAAEALAQARAAGADAATIDYALAALGFGPVSATSPVSYVRELFDEYADRFDRHLVAHLDYRAPQHVADMVQRLGLPAGLDVVDLGCGTGLCGPLLRPFCRRLVGVDLSPKMLEQAEPRDMYDELVCDEITAFAQSRPAAFDLATAADVLIYLGDLVAPFAALHHMLRPGGWLVFTIELGSSEGVTLQRSRRFAHTQHHVQAASEASQLLFKHFETCVLRRERNQDVVGGLVALQRPV